MKGLLFADGPIKESRMGYLINMGWIRLALGGMCVGLVCLSGCGGSGTPADGVHGFVQRATSTAPFSRFLSPRTAGPAVRSTQLRSLAGPALTADELFVWVESLLPSVFPSGSSTQTLLADGTTYKLRFYAASGSYLGVNEGDGLV